MTNNYEQESETTSFRQLLLDVARPDLYRRNAFRVIRLPVRVSEREIRKYLRETELRRQFGGDASAATGLSAAPSPLPLTPEPNAELIAEAQARLARPERRFVDEFFWFWSDDAEALITLSGNDVDAASDLWIKQTESSANRWTSVHDIAVMFHAAALDLEWAAADGGTLTDERKQQRDKYWQNCIAVWRLALTREEVWQHLKARVAEIDDPRVTPEMADELRGLLPVVLLCINARLAAQASQRGDYAEAQRQTAIMRDFNFDEEMMEEARGLVVEPLRRRIYDLCQTLSREARDAPEHAEQPIQRSLKESRSLLVAINDLLPEQDARIGDARDAVASSANDAAVAKYQLLPPDATREWERAKQFFERLRVIAASGPLRNIIEQNIGWADAHLQAAQGGRRPEPQPCWFCATGAENRYSEDIRLYKYEPARNHYWYEDVAVPRCDGCYTAHMRATRVSTWGGIAGASVGVSLWVGLLAYLWPSLDAYISRQNFFWSFIMLLAAVAISLGVLFTFGQNFVYKRAWPNISDGVRPLEHRMAFPQVAQRLREGWTTQKPSN